MLKPDPEPLQTSAVDEVELAEVERELRDRRSQRLQQVRQQLSTKEGRKWVWDELVAHGLYEDITGPVEAVYAALGRRREGLRLFMEVNRHPDLALQMMHEAMQRGRDERRERERRRRTRKATADAT